jgi:hypothetical protein
MVKKKTTRTTRPYLLYVALASALIPTAVIIFLNSGNNNSLLSLPGENNKQEQQSNGQGQGEEDDDDYYLRGALNSSSGGGKQVPEKYVKHLCGTSFESNTYFIQEYSIPFICSQPVGVAVDNNDKVWIAATWVGYLVVFDPDLKRFTDFIKIPNWKTKGIFGSMV